MDSTEIDGLRAALGRLSGQEAVRNGRRVAHDLGAMDTSAPNALDDGLVEMGLPLLLLPEELGGAGGGLAELTLVLAEFGRHAVASDLADDAVASYIIGKSTASIAAELAARLSGGSRIAVDDAYFRADWARPHGRDAQSNGVRIARWSSDEPAGVVSIVADAQGAMPIWIPWPALTVTDERRDAAGMRRLSLRADRAESAVVLGESPGELVARASSLARVAMASWLLGVSEGSRQLVVDYGRLRESFGRLIGSYQAFKQRCAESWVATTILGALLRECVDAWERDDNTAAALPSAAAGLACETASLAGSDGILLHGAIGFTWEHDAHLYLRAALSACSRLGGATSQLGIAGSELGFSVAAS